MAEWYSWFSFPESPFDYKTIRIKKGIYKSDTKTVDPCDFYLKCEKRFSKLNTYQWQPVGEKVGNFGYEAKRCHKGT